MIPRKIVKNIKAHFNHYHIIYHYHIWLNQGNVPRPLKENHKGLDCLDGIQDTTRQAMLDKLTGLNISNIW